MGPVRLLGGLSRPVVTAGRPRMSGDAGLTIIGWHRVDGRQRRLVDGVDGGQRNLDVLDGVRAPRCSRSTRRSRRSMPARFAGPRR